MKFIIKHNNKLFSVNLCALPHEDTVLCLQCWPTGGLGVPQRDGSRSSGSGWCVLTWQLPEDDTTLSNQRVGKV